MAHIIVLGNEKGGSGKSTTAMHVATALARLGFVTGGIDLDLRQTSFARYIENRRNTISARGLDTACPLMLEMPEPDPSNLGPDEHPGDRQVRDAVEQAAPRCDFIVIDCPGSHTRLSKMAHAMADTLITPMNDSFVDFDLLARIDPETNAVKGPSVYAEMVWQARQTRARAQSPATDWIVVRNRLGSQDMVNKAGAGRVVEAHRLPRGAGVFGAGDLSRVVPDGDDAVGSARSWGGAAQYLQPRRAAGVARSDPGAEPAGRQRGFLTGVRCLRHRPGRGAVPLALPRVFLER